MAQMVSPQRQDSGSSAHSRDSGTQNAQGTEDESIVAWAKQGYAMPAESDLSRPDLKGKFRPQQSDIPGITIALTVIGIWALVFCHALFQVRLPPVILGKYDPKGDYSHPLHVIGVFFLLEFLYSGLFITAHDAMHGTIALRHRKVNDFLGQLCLALYAWFDYNKVHEKHWEHHNHTGKVGGDPDFHQGNPNPLLWFGSFMMQYLTLWQTTRIAWWALAMTVLGCPFENLVLYMAGSALVSASRLFYYGTYMPHHPDPSPTAGKEEMGWARSRTTQASRLVSFFTCYHFDMHWEHHRWPYAAWWELPRCRELSGRTPSNKNKAV